MVYQQEHSQLSLCVLTHRSKEIAKVIAETVARVHTPGEGYAVVTTATADATVDEML